MQRWLPRLIACLVVGSGALFGVSAIGVADLLGTDTAQKLADKGMLTRSGPNKTLIYMPKIEAQSDVASSIAARPSSVAGESLFLLKSAAATDRNRADIDAYIYSAMSSFSGLTGLKYWSATKKPTRVLYSKVFRIAALDSSTPIADPEPVLSGAIPPKQDFFVRVEDAGTGKYLYHYQFFAQPGITEITFSNTNQVNFGPFSLFKPGDLLTYIMIAQTDEGILFYVLSLAKAPGYAQGSLKDKLWERAVAGYSHFEEGMKPKLEQLQATKP